MTRKIPLSQWAARHYSPVPSAWVLRRWVADGEISPAPERVGRAWYVLETAQRGAPVEAEAQAGDAPPVLSLVERLRARLEEAA